MDQLRLSDAERDSALAALAGHYAAGRLDRDEFDERSDAVWSAKTTGDLAPVFADLPTASRVRPVAGRPRRLRSPLPLLPVLFALAVLTVLTHRPFILLGLLALCVLGRHRWVR